MRFRAQIVFAILCAPLGAAAATPRVAFDTEGGDAWAFEHTVKGMTAHRACDAVFVRSPGGSVRAYLDGDRFIATVQLRSGDNQLRAQCWQGGKYLAQSRIQHWQVGLPDI